MLLKELGASEPLIVSKLSRMGLGENQHRRTEINSRR